MKNEAAALTQEIIDEIFSKTRELSDREYVECLEEIAGVCDDAASIKRREMSDG